MYTAPTDIYMVVFTVLSRKTFTRDGYSNTFLTLDLTGPIQLAFIAHMLP